MASDITPSAAFATANLKPIPDEQADALWAQSIADNTGFLYGRPVAKEYANVYAGLALPTSGVRTIAGSVVMDMPFFRVPGHNTFVGSAVGTNIHSLDSPVTADCYGTMVWGIYGDLGTYLDTTTYSTFDPASPYTRVTSWATTIALTSYVSLGSMARFRYTVGGTTTDPDGNGTISFAMNNINFKTKWA